MRISDWSSDVCSSDLYAAGSNHRTGRPARAPCPCAGKTGHVSPSGQRWDHRLERNQMKPSGGARLFNSALETGVRSALILDAARPRSFDLAHLTWLDHLVVHTADIGRSEEHTSELQSLMRTSYAVFCLKKKKTKHTMT